MSAVGGIGAGEVLHLVALEWLRSYRPGHRQTSLVRALMAVLTGCHGTGSQDMSSDLVELYRAAGSAEAHSLRLHLEDHGITAVVHNELLQGAVGELPMGWSTAPRLLVPAGSIEQAQVLLKEFLDIVAARRRLKDDDLCLRCGELMADVERCPKCGWTFLASEPETAGAPESADPLSVTDWQSLAAQRGQMVEPEGAPQAVNPESVPVRVSQQFDRKSVRNEVLAVLVMFVLPLCFYAGFDWWQPRTDAIPFVASELVRMVAAIAATTGVLFVISKSGEPFAAFGIDRPRLGDLALGCVVWFMMLMAATFTVPKLAPYGFNPVGELPSAEVREQWAITLPSCGWHYGLLVLSFLATSCFEEVLVRGYLLTRFEQLWGSKVMATLVASGLFATWHVYQGPLAVPYSFVMGATLALIFFMLRRLWPLVIGHALYNCLVYWYFVRAMEFFQSGG